MRLLPLTLLLCLFSAAAAGQELAESDCANPLLGVQRLYSANFGEMRPDHFHSGVDFKTDGVTGKRVVAVADGYVSRLSLHPSGYGRALYITHPDGTTSVYGHLSQFRDDIEKYVRDERLLRGVNSVDMWFAAWQWPVSRGEVIALSGNTGNSFGPHLHFEIRETLSQRTLNTLAAKQFYLNDDIPPVIARLRYIEIDTLRGVPVNAPAVVCDVRRLAPGFYCAASEAPLRVGRNGYFVLEASDRKNGVQNTFGLYRVTASLDGQPRFEYRMDGFLFSDTRYCNAVSYYPVQTSSRNEAIRLARLDGNLRSFYTELVDDGRIGLDAGQRAALSIEVCDEAGNVSRLELQLEGKPDEECFRAADPGSEVVDRRRDFSHADRWAEISIPAGTLYESAFFRYSAGTKEPPAGSRAAASAVCSIFDTSVPLHRSISLAIRCDMPPSLQRHAALAWVNRRGKAVYAGGSYADGAVRGQVRNAGDYYVTADTVAPKITLRFTDGADLSRASTVSFGVSDDFSGIGSYECYIDGQFALLDYMPVGGLLIHRFADSRLKRGAMHTVRVVVTDNCGNRRETTARFRR
ncbi:MAG: M23 family metallopeptidase [Alistipes sp.]|nr:M23 family metallopeptidase [Alistipes sp.]